MADSLISDVASRTGLSQSAVQALYDALVRGGGSQAQFSHPDLGGMGQWMRGGMTMVGDMFNSSLSAKVSQACSLLSERAREEGVSEQAGMWPREWGNPSMGASQNGLDYAIFPQTSRLAVREKGHTDLYDIAGLNVTGVGVQSGSSIVVQTSAGPRQLGQLRAVDPRE